MRSSHLFQRPVDSSSLLNFNFFNTISQDGELGAFGFYHTIYLCSLKTHQRLGELTGHHDNIKCITISDNNLYLASVSIHNIIKIWNLETKECVYTLQGKTSSVSRIVFIANDQWLMTGCEDSIYSAKKEIEVWDFKRGLSLGMYSQFYHVGEDYSSGSGITHLAISPDGQIVPGTQGDYLVSVSDSEKGDDTIVAQDENGNPVHLSIKHHEQATTGYDNEIIVPIWPKNVAKPMRILGLQRSEDGEWFLLRHECGIQQWHAKKGFLRTEIHTPPNEWKTSTISPTGNKIALGKMNGIGIVDAEKRLFINTLSHTGESDYLQFTRDEKKLISKAYNTIKIFDCENWTCLHTFSIVGLYNAIKLLPSPDNTLLFVESKPTRKEVRVQVFSLNTGECVYEKEIKRDVTPLRNPPLQAENAENLLTIQEDDIPTFGANVHINSICFSVDSKTIALGLSDKTIRLIECETGQSSYLRGHNGSVSNIVFSEDNQWIASASEDNTVKIWGHFTQHCLLTIESAIQHILFLPDKRFMVLATNQMIYLWDIDRQCSIRTYDTGSRIYGLTFLNDALWVENCRHHLQLINITPHIKKAQSKNLEKINVNMQHAETVDPVKKTRTPDTLLQVIVKPSLTVKAILLKSKIPFSEVSNKLVLFKQQNDSPFRLGSMISDDVAIRMENYFNHIGLEKVCELWVDAGKTEEGLYRTMLQLLESTSEAECAM